MLTTRWNPRALAMLACTLLALGCGARVTEPGDGEEPTDAVADTTRPDSGPDTRPDVPTGCIAPDGHRMSPGESYYDGCNTCVCGPDGTVGCTARYCPPDGGPPPPDGVTPPPDAGTTCRTSDGRVLLPGESSYDGCNTCYCQFDGLLACTARYCPPDGGVDGGVDSGVVCVAPDGSSIPPGGFYSAGCLACYCDARSGLICRTICVDGGLDGGVDSGYDGGRVDASYDARYDGGPIYDVPPPPDSGALCRAADGTILFPGQYYYDGCNDCYCGPDGALFCTDRVCTDGGVRSCARSSDCNFGEVCDGPPGCGVRWTCQAARPCTDDWVPYCTCSGVTTWGSSTCAPEPYLYRGTCGSTDGGVTEAGVDAGVCDGAWRDFGGVCRGSFDQPLPDWCCGASDGGTERWQCDANLAWCATPAPVCPRGEMASVVDGCWGPCIPVSWCAPIACDPARTDSCPPPMVCSFTGTCVLPL